MSPLTELAPPNLKKFAEMLENALKEGTAAGKSAAYLQQAAEEAKASNLASMNLSSWKPCFYVDQVQAAFACFGGISGMACW